MEGGKEEKKDRKKEKKRKRLEVRVWLEPRKNGTSQQDFLHFKWSNKDNKTIFSSVCNWMMILWESAVTMNVIF